jgi:hypothetical protein
MRTTMLYYKVQLRPTVDWDEGVARAENHSQV